MNENSIIKEQMRELAKKAYTRAIMHPFETQQEADAYCDGLAKEMADQCVPTDEDLKIECDFMQLDDSAIGLVAETKEDLEVHNSMQRAKLDGMKEMRGYLFNTEEKKTTKDD